MSNSSSEGPDMRIGIANSLNFVKLDQGYLISDDSGQMSTAQSLEEIDGNLQGRLNGVLRLIRESAPALKKFESLKVMFVVGEGDAVLSVPSELDPETEKILDLIISINPDLKPKRSSIIDRLKGITSGGDYASLLKVVMNTDRGKPMYHSEYPDGDDTVLRQTSAQHPSSGNNNHQNGNGYGQRNPQHDRSNNNKNGQRPGGNSNGETPGTTKV